jgi:choline-sulfatase
MRTPMPRLWGQTALLGLVGAGWGAASILSSDCTERSAPFAAVGIFGALGVLLCAAARALRGLALLVERRSGGRISERVALALIAASAAVVPARSLFSGAGVRQTALASIGPPLLTLAVAVLAWAAGRWFVPLLRHGTLRARIWLSLHAMLAALAVALIGRLSYPGLYRGVHFLLVLCAVSLALVAAAPFTRRVLPRGPVVGAIVLLLLGGGLALSEFGRKNRQRLCLEGASELAYFASYLRDHVDLDGDGASSLFGGGDCNDFSASVGPAAADPPGDGRDQDCDGHDGQVEDVRTWVQHFRVDPAMATRIAAQARKRPTVVILVDALRWDRLDRPEFPSLRALAAESIRFDRAYSHSSSTESSLAAMMTGRVQPPDTQPSFVQRLRAAGKHCAYVGVEAVTAELGRLYPVLVGFNPIVRLRTPHERGAWGAGVGVRTSRDLVHAATALLDSKTPPDLLWLHLFDVHQWHQLFGAMPGGNDVRYDAAVKEVDRSLAPLLARRDRINIVLLADHGESLAALRRSWHTMYVGPSVVHVPWLIRVPEIPPARITAIIGLSEVAPTLLDLTGLELPADLTRRSALGLVGVADPGFGPPIFAFESREWSILEQGLRLRYAPRSHAVSLYDVVNDPFERVDLSDRLPAKVSELHAMLLSRVRTIEGHGGPLRYGYGE